MLHGSGDWEGDGLLSTAGAPTVVKPHKPDRQGKGRYNGQSHRPGGILQGYAGLYPMCCKAKKKEAFQLSLSQEPAGPSLELRHMEFASGSQLPPQKAQKRSKPTPALPTLSLLHKGAICVVPPDLSQSSFYSRYVLVPKWGRGVRDLPYPGFTYSEQISQDVKNQDAYTCISAMSPAMERLLHIH